MRWSVGLCGFHVPFMLIERRGPEPNCHTTPSVNPWKWQLAQFCHPTWDMRSSVDTVVPVGRSKWPREEKKSSLPTCSTSSCVPGDGREPIWIAVDAVSLVRFTTDTVREMAHIT